MIKKTAFFTVASLLASPAHAALQVSIGGVANNQPLPANFAFCMPDGKGKTKNADNINPQIRWSGAPAETKSFALLVVDPDVPADFTDANQDGKIIPDDAPRQNFYHWVLVDIPSDVNFLKQGQDSSSHRDTGKPTGKTIYGTNGKNDFAKFMKGTFGGYDGPCPPWNDQRVHHYHFRVYALDVTSLGLLGDFTGEQAEAMIAKHTLDMAEAVGTYTNAKR